MDHDGMINKCTNWAKLHIAAGKAASERAREMLHDYQTNESLLGSMHLFEKGEIDLASVDVDVTDIYGNLAMMLFESYQSIGDESLLAVAIGLQKEVLGLCPPGHTDRGMACSSLGLSLWTRFNSTGDDLLLAEALNLQRESVDLCPIGDPNRAVTSTNLANSLLTRFNSVGDISLLTEAIAFQRESLALCPLEHHYRALICGNLALSLWTCFNSVGDDALLTEAISLQQESLALSPPEHPNRGLACTSLANSLLYCFNKTGDDALLTECIQLQRESLALCLPEHPNRAVTCGNLAQSLWKRFNSTGNDSLLTEAIDLQRESLTLSPPGHSNRGVACTNLASSLVVRFNETGDATLLTESIQLQRESLALYLPGHTNRAAACRNLALALWTRFESTGDDSLLNEAIDLQRESHTLHPPGHPDRALACTNLANSLLNRFHSTGDDVLLTEAIALQRESLSSLSPKNPNRAVTCGNLAQSLWRRFNSTGNDSLLTEAIDLQRESLTLSPPGHPNRGVACTNLASSLVARFGSTGDDLLLTEAMQLQRESLDLCPSGHPNRRLACMNLAQSLWTRFEDIGDDALLTEAVDLQRESLALSPPGHPNRALACTNLANSLLTRFASTGVDHLLTEAIALQRESLTLCPPGHPNRALSCSNLAQTLWMRFNSTDDIHLEDEISAVSTEGLSLAFPSAQWGFASTLALLYLHPHSKFCDLTTGIQYVARSLKSYPDNPSAAISNVIHCLDIFWTMHRDPDIKHHIALIPVYKKLISLLPFVSNPARNATSQVLALSGCYELGSEAFINAMLAGEWVPGVEELEVVQGMWWSQRLYYRDPQLEHVPGDLSDELQSLLKAIVLSSKTPGLIETPSTPEVSRDIQNNNVIRLSALLREIRALPGLDRFMLGETFATLHSVAFTHPVVALVGAHDHYYALLLQKEYDECTVIKLTLKESDLTAMATMISAARSHRGATDIRHELVEGSDNRGMKVTKQDPLSSIYRQMRNLWLHIVRPVLEKLGMKLYKGNIEARPRLHWYPTGDFTSLPLHAAGIYDGPSDVRISCSDYVVSSYTPTLTTLLRAQKANRPLRRETSRVALLAEKKAQEPHLQVLHEVDVEVNIIASVARSRNVGEVAQLPSPVTVLRASMAMQDANIVHLACHGIQDESNALDSGFCLGDGRLRISELMNLKLKSPFLAFLSACETAKGDENQPDQALHLAAAMLFIGFKTVVATMWAISDVDGPKVAGWFYEELFAKEIIDSDSVAYALDSAVGKLRKSGVSLDRWAPFIHIGA